MTNINQIVWKILESDLAIQKDMARKLINTRALAKYIIKRHSLKASLDSVISSIRRFDIKGAFQESEKVIKDLFKDAAVTTKNNVVCITLKNDSFKQLPRLLESFGTVDTLRFIRGSRNIKIISDVKDLKRIKSVFLEKDIVNIEKDLSEISIVISEKAIKTKGVLARMANEISLQNINIWEMIICPPEFLICVKESDVVKAHETILELCR